MALEITSRNPTPTPGGYSSVNVTFTLKNGVAYFTGGVDLPGKFATVSDSEVLEEIRKQIALQMYTGESTPALVSEYANLRREVTILAGGKDELNEREKALRKLITKVNKGNDKVIMALLLNVLDPKTINTKKDVIINAFDSYEVNTDYSVGDKFKYQNKLYEVLEDHTSVEVWEPNAEGTIYKEIVLTREESNVKDDIEDEKNRYVTKGQLDEAMGSVINTILSMFEEEEEKEDEHTEEHNGNLPHNEGSFESHETE
nr:MAG TPA: ChiA1-BD-binding domain protein [Caudoviricetes sp.]